MNDVTWTEVLTDSVLTIADRILQLLPNLLGFAALLVVGWLVARGLRSALRALVSRALERLSSVRGVESTAERSPTFRSLPGVTGAVAFWIVFLFFAAAGVEALGLPAVSNVLGIVTVYLPRIVTALLVVLAALWGGDLLRTVIARGMGGAGMGHGDALGRIAHGLVVLLGIIIAIEQIGIDSTVLVTLLATTFAASMGAAGLAFGLGARAMVGNIIAARYVRQSFREGDAVRVAGHEGEIVEITDTTVVLRGADGMVMVPAQRFSDEISVRVREGS